MCRTVGAPNPSNSLFHQLPLPCAPPMYFGMFELGAISAALALRLSTAVNKDPESGCARWQGMGADAMVLCWLLVAVLLALHSILFAEPDHVTEGIVDSFLRTYAVFPVIAAVFMFCATANTGYAVAMLKHPVISRLGDYSFAVYLWQAALELGPLWPCQALAILRNCTRDMVSCFGRSSSSDCWQNRWVAMICARSRVLSCSSSSCTSSAPCGPTLLRYLELNGCERRCGGVRSMHPGD